VATVTVKVAFANAREASRVSAVQRYCVLVRSAPSVAAVQGSRPRAKVPSGLTATTGCGTPEREARLIAVPGTNGPRTLTVLPGG